MQELLEKVGLLRSSDVDGKYGSGTATAVKNFQKFVNNNTGGDTLAITGECDLLTQQYLRYCVENNIKATTEEGLGFTGEGLGIAAHAVALLNEK